MLNDCSLAQQTVAVLDKYLRHHKLHSASTKKAKLCTVQRHITHQSTATSQTAEKEKSDSDSGDESEIEATFSSCDEDETDIVLVDSSSDEDDETQAGNDAEMTSNSNNLDKTWQEYNLVFIKLKKVVLKESREGHINLRKAI